MNKVPFNRICELTGINIRTFYDKFQLPQLLLFIATQLAIAIFTTMRLTRLMNTAGAPMYQFAQIIDFPFLGDDFLRLLAEHFRKVHPGKKLGLDELREGFKKIGFKLALMRDVVKAMSAEGITDVSRVPETVSQSDDHEGLHNRPYGKLCIIGQSGHPNI